MGVNNLVKLNRGLGARGRPGNSTAARRALEVARAQGARTLARTIRRFDAILSDPSTPIDDFIKAFRELADRCGLPRLVLQQSTSDVKIQGGTLTSLSAEEMHSIGQEERELWRQVVREGLSSADVGRVKPVDADFTVCEAGENPIPADELIPGVSTGREAGEPATEGDTPAVPEASASSAEGKTVQ